MSTTTSPQTETVIAEDAPLGVQLWPTRSPEFAPNFTLDQVNIHRTEARTYVEWIYQNGNTRVFALGEEVAAKLS